MPIRTRRSDESPRQEWATDRSNDGKPSGDHSLEVLFDDDAPDGTWTTHLFATGDNEHRLNRGDQTAIVLEGLSRERAAELTQIICDIDDRRGAQRTKILDALSQDGNLDWAA